MPLQNTDSGTDKFAEIQQKGNYFLLTNEIQKTKLYKVTLNLLQIKINNEDREIIN